MFKILLAVCAVCFVLVSDSLAQCPLLFPPITRTRVTVVHKHIYSAPMVAVQAAPVVSVPVIEAPAPEVIAPAPTVTYSYRAAPMYAAAPMVSSYADVGVGSGSAAASRKAARHAAKALYHGQRAAYWATR